MDTPTAPLQRGKNLPNGATFWPWVVTRKALGQRLGGWAVIDPATEWSMAYNTPLWPLLGLMGDRIVLIPSIGWSYQALAPICYIPTVLLNLHLQKVPNPYLLFAGRWWLSVNYVERIGIWLVLRTWNWQRLGVYWSRIPVSTKVNGFPLCSFPTQVGLLGGWWGAGPTKNMLHI